MSVAQLCDGHMHGMLTFSPLLNQGNLALAVADRKIETQCTWSILYQPRKVVWPSLDENSAPA